MSPVSQTSPATSRISGAPEAPTTRARWCAAYIAGRRSVFDPAFTFTKVLTVVVLTEFTRVTRKPEGATKKRPGSSQRAGGSPPRAAIASLQTGARAAGRAAGGSPDRKRLE